MDSRQQGRFRYPLHIPALRNRYYSCMSDGDLYSLAYSKHGDAVYFSHLDTLRILERAVRRSGIPVCFTRGLNPHIRLSVYTALPVGVETEGEWFSIRLTRSMDPESLRDLLNGQLPSGFAIAEARIGRPPPVGNEAFMMGICFKDSRREWEKAAARWMERERIEVRTVRKGKEQVVDVRPFLARHESKGRTICFYINKLDGREPRVSDLARAFRALASSEGLNPDVIKIVRDPSTVT